MQLCFPEDNAQQRAERVRRILYQTGMNILETGKMWCSRPGHATKLVRSCENQQLIDQALAEGRGVILAMPHHGSWELSSLYCAKQYPLSTLYAPQKNPRVEKLIKQCRERSGAKLYPTDATGIRSLSKALKNKEVVAILPDQSPKENGIFTPFFGQTCYTATLLPKLAQKTNALVIYAYAQRLPASQGFKLVFRKAAKDLATLELKQAAAQLNLDMEELIREYPDQYQWTYNRFKKQPQGLQPDPQPAGAIPAYASAPGSAAPRNI